MSIRSRTGSTRIRRSTTNASPRWSVNTASRAGWIVSPPQLEGGPVSMRMTTVFATLILVPVGIGSLAAQTTGVRDVSASDRSLIPLQTRIRYTTMVILPEDEEVLDVVCGDRDFWVISAAQNIAHVKPAKEG